MPFITLVACGYQRKKGIVLIPLSVIPLGFEPKTHSLEGYPSEMMLYADM